MIMALTIGVLVAGGVYLVQQRGMVRLVLGMQLIGHAANLTLLAAGVGAWRGEVFLDRTDRADVADPLPQAFVLTAIVISMATATIMLTMAAVGRSDDTRSVDPVASPDPLSLQLSPISTLGRATVSPEAYAAYERSVSARFERLRQGKEQRR